MLTEHDAKVSVTARRCAGEVPCHASLSYAAHLGRTVCFDSRHLWTKYIGIDSSREQRLAPAPEIGLGALNAGTIHSSG